MNESFFSQLLRSTSFTTEEMMLRLGLATVCGLVLGSTPIPRCRAGRVGVARASNPKVEFHGLASFRGRRRGKHHPLMTFTPAASGDCRLTAEKLGALPWLADWPATSTRMKVLEADRFLH
jgi:hypothetical protein